MSTPTHTERPAPHTNHRSDDPAACPVCEHLRAESPIAVTHSMVPARSGGWVAWSTALVALLRTVAGQPTQAIVIEQPGRTQRYVQLLVGHGLAHVETSSNEFLRGSSRLSGVDERLLTLLGWQQPHSTGSTDTASSPNWSLPLERGDWANLTETLTATVVGILGFSEQLPVEMHTFLADHPCRSCSWPDEFNHEIDDTYGTLGF